MLLGTALSWGVAKLNPALVATLTTLYPIEYSTLEMIIQANEMLKVELRECREKKSA